MIRLQALRAFIAVWARAISLSDKLRERTWKLLVVIQCVIFILSAAGFRESKLPSPASSDTRATRIFTGGGRVPLALAEPERRSDVALARPPAKSYRRAFLARRKKRAVGHTLPLVVAGRGLHPLRREYARRTRRHLIVTSLRRTPAAQARAVLDNFGAHGIREALMVSSGRAVASEIMHAYKTNGSWLPDELGSIIPDRRSFIVPTRIISAPLSLPESGDYKKALLFWVSLFGLIVSPINLVSTAVIAWISIHRGRADELLKRAQIEKTKLEVELLRAELERARSETAPHQPRIVISNG